MTKNLTTAQYKAVQASEDAQRLAREMKRWRQRRDEEIRRRNIYIYAILFFALAVIASLL
jgi:hypothetical protein